MAPKKGKDDRPPIFAAIDKGDDDAVEELLKDDPGNLSIRNKVLVLVSCCWNSMVLAAEPLHPTNLRMDGHPSSLHHIAVRSTWCGC